MMGDSHTVHTPLPQHEQQSPPSPPPPFAGQSPNSPQPSISRKQTDTSNLGNSFNFPDDQNSSQPFIKPSETIDESEVTAMSLLSTNLPPPQPPARSISPVDESNKNLFLIRGLPGSGKTTKANQLTNDNTVGTILATDDYFYGDNGEYVFNKDDIQRAHKWNQNRTENEMKSETSPICIDNTNITKAEMKPYVELADKYGYKVYLVEPWRDTDWKHNTNKCLEKSSKGASLKKKVLDNMKKKYAKNVTIDEIRECKSKFD